MNGLFGKIVGAINKDLTPGYTVGEAVPSHDVAEVWSLQRATARDTGAQALAFIFDPSRSRSAAAAHLPSSAELAKAALSQIKRLKHPDVLRYITSAEHSDGGVFIATEPATPLATLLADPNGKPLEREAIQWGLFTIARALGFLHQSGLIHGRVNAASIFVTPSGDWKLGGLEIVTPHTNAAALSRFVGLQPIPYQSPEFANGNWSAVAASSPGAVDSWALGCLMFHAHKGVLTSPEQLRDTSVLPKALLTAYQKLLASNPGARAPAAQVPSHPYFKNSKFVELNMFVENLALKGELEREAFLGKLPSIVDGLPDGFCTFKVLPMLSESIEMGRGAGPAFACVLKMKDRLSESDFDTFVVKGHAVKWYGNSALDRGIRTELYTKMEVFAKHFDSATVNSTIFTAMASAFQDAQAPALRDSAIKSVLCIAPVLNEKNLNTNLLSHFARLQVDPEPAIRTNTTVCLGRLANRLNVTTRSKVLIPAFLRALKDPFPPARAAGSNAILQTWEMYNAKDIAIRIIPAVAPLLVDQATDVRGLAFKLMSTFQPILDRNHEEMTRAAESAATTSNGAISTSSSSSSHVQSSSSGWGLSSLTSMTAALLTAKSDAGSTSSSRAATGGISSEDFKNGALIRPVGAPATGPALGVSSTGSTFSAGGGFGLSQQGVVAQGDLGLVAAESRPGAQGEDFGDFESAKDTNDDETGARADDDDDGWGDMKVTNTEQVSAPGVGSRSMNEEDDFLALLGPPVNLTRKTVPSGVASRSGMNTDKAASVVDPWAMPSVEASSANSVLKPSGSVGKGLMSTGGSESVAKPITGSSSVAGMPSQRRTTASKKGGPDDWEALLSGVGSAPKRKGLGATRR